MSTLDRRRPNAALALADGTVFLGFGGGCPGVHEGELVFNTSITGYQEILTDPSYAGQIVTFTFPHIGNVGTQRRGYRSAHTVCKRDGGARRRSPTRPTGAAASTSTPGSPAAASPPSAASIPGASRGSCASRGAQNAALAYLPDGDAGPRGAQGPGQAAPSLEGMDLAAEVSCRQRYA